MKEKIRVSFVATYFILLAFLIVIFLKQVRAQTITTPNNTKEEVEIQNVENLQKNENDTLKIKQDSLNIEDSSIYEDSLHITSIDSIISDTTSAEFIPSVSPISSILRSTTKDESGSPDGEENYTTIIDTSYSHFIPSLFKKKLLNRYINYDDSNAVFTYLYHKEFPPYIIDYHFLIDRLYSFSEEIDMVENNALINIRFGKAEIIPPFSVPLEKFWELKRWKKFQESFYNELLQSKLGGERIRDLEGIIPDIEFPKIKMPGAMRRFFGDNIGRLRVTGSQKITIGGTKTTHKPRLDKESTRRSILPDLTMKQDLNLGINGTIGDKIKVDVKQTSEESIFKKNKISIKYEGDEDDPIKLIEGGDTRLSLSGSHFISYSASSEDLFGLKGNFEFGKLKLTTIVGQQEGEQASATATGTSMEDFTEYRDMDFARNKYFFIGSPDTDDPNTIFHEEDGKLIPTDTLMPKEGSVRVFVDDRGTDPTYIPGYSIDDQGHEVEYEFQEYLISPESADFFVDYLNSPDMIEFNKSIGNNYIIGLIYEDRTGQTYGHDYGDSLEVKLIKEDYTNVSQDSLAAGGALWDYQLKNIYSLGGRNIEKQGFEVDIYRYLPDGKKEEGIITDTTYTPFIEILNLDRNRDGRVDDIDGTVDFEKGIIMFPMLEPFRSVWFAEYDATLGNDIIYDKLRPDPEDYNPFYISVKMKRTAGQINLGHINIIKNSEKVYIDGDLKKSGVDYTIDYMSGTVTLLGDAALDPNVPVRVNFEYEPLFALDKKNMFGVRAEYKFNKNAKLGATIMYESGSVRDERPKVGNEPKKILVGDIDGKISMGLPFITNLVDRMPLIKTQEKSTLSLSGEIAMNIPNPNATDKQEAYIDDMEGVIEAYPLGTGRTDWTFASFPLSIEPEDSTRGDLQWYNPYHKFQAKDIYQDLTETEGKEYVSVLEMKLQSDTTLFPNSEPPIWGGIMKAFGTSPVDFSKKEFLEITMKSDENYGDSLFIDLGFMSEDYYPILHPNSELDEEDGCVNGIKDGELDIGEDIGLDRVKGNDPSPPKNHSQDGTPGIDDGNDDYNYDPGSYDYDKINGTEGNNHLDTEDLNRNARLDIKNNYLQYAIDLSSLDINSEIVICESENKEWKFIRIPLQDSTYFIKKGSGDVDFSLIKYARIWAKSDSSASLTIDLAAINVVGNKWKASAILDTNLVVVDSMYLGTNEEFEIATDNNKENPDYTPPPGSIDKREEKRTKEKQIEQSIFLDCKNIQPNRYLYARQNFVNAINLLLYNKVKLWVYGQTEDSTKSNEETIIFRLGADTLNYYECRKKIKLYEDIEDKMLEKRWQDISIDFVDFSGLKKSGVPDTTAHFRIVGNPSLGYIKQIAVGLIRPDTGDSEFSGKIYFDDIRVANPCDEMGVASRISFSTKIADIADISASFSNQTPNFYTLGQERGGGTNSYKYTLSNKISLNKFLPGSWGFNIPLRVDYSFSESKPRFQPNSDVELTSEAEKDSLKTLAETKTASVNFSKSKKSSNPFVKYLIDNLKLSARASNKVSLSPTRKDTSKEYSGSVNYNLSFSRNNSIGVFKDFKLYYLPQKISLKLDYNYSHSDIWTKQSGEGGIFINENKNKKPDEKLKPFFKIDYEIFSDFKTDYSLRTTRDLQKRNQVKNLNIGVESNKNQKINVGYAPGYLKFISFSTNYSTDYGQIRGEDDTLLIEYEVSNNRSFDAGLTLRFDKWGKDLMKATKLLSYSEKEGNGGEKNDEKIEEKEEGAKNDLLDETEIEIEEIENEGELDSLEIPKEENKKEVKKITPFKRIATISGKVIGFGIKSLGSTKLSYSNKYNTKYYDVPGDSLPDFNYQIGITDLNYGDLKSINQTDNISISTSNRFNILPTLNADVKVNYKQTFVNKNTGKSNSNSLTFPDVTLTYSGLDNIIPWDLVSNSSVSGGVNRVVTKTGPTFPSETDKITINSSFSLPINILKTLNPKLSGNYTHTYDKNSNTKIENKNDELNLFAGIKYSFQSEKGIKIPLLKRIKVKNKLDTSLDISYNSNLNQKYIPANKIWDTPDNNNALKIEPRISYSFSRDINGGLTGIYKYYKDKKKGESTQTTELNIWVEFKF
ncbi:MAG: cell surface protein SprA [Candidatus Cloacimonadota bacterium]|nr:cell surface protein SprA [Candidatus Cloacimonadota bacterium]